MEAEGPADADAKASVVGDTCTVVAGSWRETADVGEAGAAQGLFGLDWLLWWPAKVRWSMKLASFGREGAEEYTGLPKVTCESKMQQDLNLCG